MGRGDKEMGRKLIEGVRVEVGIGSKSVFEAALPLGWIQ
jgi:hypothetical protein